MEDLTKNFFSIIVPFFRDVNNLVQRNLFFVLYMQIACQKSSDRSGGTASPGLEGQRLRERKRGREVLGPDGLSGRCGLSLSLHRAPARDTMRLMVDIARLIEEKTGRRPSAGIRLESLSNFRIGGPADHYFEAAAADELRTVVELASGSGYRHYVIGGGFNLLFDDAGYRGLIIRVACRGFIFEPKSSRLIAQAGTPLSDLTGYCRDRGLGGLEFLAGIPGTVGGAVYGNAGAFGCSIGDVLEEADLLDPGGKERIKARPADLSFAYRDSRLKKTREILLSAAFRAVPADKTKIGTCMDSYIALRTERHPSRDTAYAGSFFKNPLSSEGTRLAAGKLLEQVGAKETTVGGAAVFHGHANFLYNRGGATAADVRKLADLLKERVMDRFGIRLEEEVIFLPAEPGAV